MYITKATPFDIANLANLLNILDDIENLEDLDNDDYDKMQLDQIAKSISTREGIDLSELDIRIVKYEYIKKLYAAARGWRRIVAGYETVLENACDPTNDRLMFHLGIEFHHVAKEQ